MSRPAEPDDVATLCAALPETWFGVTWGDVPTWLVGDKETGKGRGFVLHRKPHRSAIDPATGEPFDDLLVIRTAGPEDSVALVESQGPFFTIDHFRGYNAVLVQESRLGEISVEELAEVLRDAWRAVAPAAVRRRHPEA